MLSAEIKAVCLIVCAFAATSCKRENVELTISRYHQRTSASIVTWGICDRETHPANFIKTTDNDGLEMIMIGLEQTQLFFMVIHLDKSHSNREYFIRIRERGADGFGIRDRGYRVQEAEWASELAAQYPSAHKFIFLPDMPHDCILPLRDRDGNILGYLERP